MSNDAVSAAPITARIITVVKTCTNYYELSLLLLSRAGAVRLRTSVETGLTVGTRHPDVPLANIITEAERSIREHGSLSLNGAIAESGGVIYSLIISDFLYSKSCSSELKCSYGYSISNKGITALILIPPESELNELTSQ